MTIRSRIALALGLGAIVALVLASTSMAIHPRPKGATPVRVAMVPAFKACTVPNSTHGAPLAAPSCNPPVQTSTKIYVGSPDVPAPNAAPANGVGFIRVDVIVGNPAPPDDSDVSIIANATDIRCKLPVATSCGAANAAGGPDYAGGLHGNATIRITDHYNGAGGTDPATVTDLPFPVDTPNCTGTGTNIGATCGVTTTANAVVAGVVKDGKRAVVEIGQILVDDGGTDGVPSTTADNTRFAHQGIFIP